MNGLLLKNIRKNTLSSNIISNNDYHGIWLERSAFNILSNNTVSYNGQEGILFYSSCNRNNITDSTISYNRNNGIHLLAVENTSISSNLISHNVGYGLFIDQSLWTSITWNNFIGNNPGGNSQVKNLGWQNSFANNYWDDRPNIEGYEQNHDENSDNLGNLFNLEPSVIIRIFILIIILCVLIILIQKQKLR